MFSLRQLHIKEVIITLRYAQLTSDTWYMYIDMVAMVTELACNLRCLFSGPSLASSITNMIGSSTQIPNNKKHL